MNKVVLCKFVKVVSILHECMNSPTITVDEIAPVHGFLAHVRSQFLLLAVHLAAVATLGAHGSACAEGNWKVRAVHGTFQLITKTC